MNIYGSEVTEATVKRQPGYDKDKEITRNDLANLALEMINDEGKRDRARAYLNGLADSYGSFNAAATKCLIYNASGATMTFNTARDYTGHVGESSYPLEIKNGEWGVFFHHKPSFAFRGSRGAVVYNLKDQEGTNSEPCVVLGWYTGWGGDPNYCYSEIPPNVDDNYFNSFEQAMDNNGTHHHKATHGKLSAELTIGADNISEWTTVITLLP